MAEVIVCKKLVDEVAGSVELEADKYACPELIIKVSGLSIAVEITGQDETAFLADDVDVRTLSTEVAGGFVGCTVGMYAVADTDSRDRSVCFKTFTYEA